MKTLEADRDAYKTKLDEATKSDDSLKELSAKIAELEPIVKERDDAVKRATELEVKLKELEHKIEKSESDFKIKTLELKMDAMKAGTVLHTVAPGASGKTGIENSQVDGADFPHVSYREMGE